MKQAISANLISYFCSEPVRSRTPAGCIRPRELFRLATTRHCRAQLLHQPLEGNILRERDALRQMEWVGGIVEGGKEAGQKLGRRYYAMKSPIAVIFLVGLSQAALAPATKSEKVIGLPTLLFIENTGQFAAPARFQARGKNGKVCPWIYDDLVGRAVRDQGHVLQPDRRPQHRLAYGIPTGNPGAQ